MTPDKHDVAYTKGQRAALRGILREILTDLGYDDAANPDVREGRLIQEREGVISQLRTLCAEFGDNDWDEHLHLADVIEKHLGKHLREKRDV